MNISVVIVALVLIAFFAIPVILIIKFGKKKD